MGTIRVAGMASTTSMPDEQMTEQGPFLRGNNFLQIILDFFRRRLAGQLEAVGKPGHVGIDHNSVVEIKSVAEDDVGRFASDASQLSQSVHGAGNLAAVFFDEGA